MQFDLDFFLNRSKHTLVNNPLKAYSNLYYQVLPAGFVIGNSNCYISDRNRQTDFLYCLSIQVSLTTIYKA